jgi:hypothetical protein
MCQAILVPDHALRGNSQQPAVVRGTRIGRKLTLFIITKCDAFAIQGTIMGLAFARVSSSSAVDPKKFLTSSCARNPLIPNYWIIGKVYQNEIDWDALVEVDEFDDPLDVLEIFFQSDKFPIALQINDQLNLNILHVFFHLGFDELGKLSTVWARSIADDQMVILVEC